MTLLSTATETKTSARSPDPRVLALIERHGWNATAFQTLAPGYAYFFAGPEACVAYVDTGRAWVAAGAPIGPPEALAEVTSAFVRAAREAGRRCCFFATEERLRHAADEVLGSLCIGEQPSWDPRSWGRSLGQSRSLREQVRRARARSVRVRLATAAELASGRTREAVTELTARWLATREMAPMAFLVQVTPFLLLSHRRGFVAEIGGQLVGFASVIPVPARGGWFIENLLRDPAAPSGTGELLVDAVMRWAAAADSSWLTLGLAPLAGELAGPLRLARRSTAFLYDFEGLHRYKVKLRPHLWSPIFLSFPPRQGALWSLFDALQAFSGGGFVRFGLRTLVRGPRVVLRALSLGLAAGALVPTVLAAGVGRPGHSWRHTAESLFLVLLALGLWWLVGRPSERRFALLVPLAVTGVLVGTVDLALEGLGGAHPGVLSVMLRGASIAAMALTAVVLREARGRHRRTR